MPVNKYNERDFSKMREMISIESAMFTPKIDDILGPDRLVKGEMLQCNYGIPAYNEMRGMHSTLAMAMALDSIKRCHNDTPIFHMPHEPVMIDYYDIHEKYSHIPVASICLPVDDFNISDVIKRNVDNFKKHQSYLCMDSITHDDEYEIANGLLGRAGLFPDSDNWATSVCRYDEYKVSRYKIPSKDRLDMLARIYKLIKGIKK